MFKKIGSSILVLVSVGLLLTACQPANTDKTDSSSSKTTKVYKDMDEFVKAVKEANKKLKSIQFDTDLEIYQQEDTPYETVSMDAEVVYEKQEIVKATAVLETATRGEVTSYQELVLPDETSAYIKKEKSGAFIKTELTDRNLNPDYFDVLEYLYDNSDDLSLEVDGDEYIVTLGNEEMSLISTFGKEYKFRVTGSFKEADAKKELILRFDKKTLFMKEFKASLANDQKLGYIKLLGKTEYSKWNKVDEDSIQAPD